MIKLHSHAIEILNHFWLLGFVGIKAKLYSCILVSFGKNFKAWRNLFLTGSPIWIIKKI